MGTYLGIFGIFKIKSALTAKPPPPPAPVVAAAAPSGSSSSRWGFEPPTLDNFNTWEANPDNWAKWEAFVNGPKLEEWCNTLK